MFQGDIKDPGRRPGGKIGEAGTRTPWPDAIIPYVFDCSVCKKSNVITDCNFSMRLYTIDNASAALLNFFFALFDNRILYFVVSIESAVKATYDAMEEWEKRTCVRFVKKQSHHQVYVEFIRAAGYAVFITLQ